MNFDDYSVKKFMIAINQNKSKLKKMVLTICFHCELKLNSL